MSRISRYFDLRRDAHGNEHFVTHIDGMALLRLPLVNKGTAFTRDERIELRLDGLLPPLVNDIHQQVERVYNGFRREPTSIAKYQYLRALQERHEVLFYALVEKHLAEMLPIVYTPTVGDAVRQYSHLYQNARGLSLSTDNVARAVDVIGNYPLEDVRMIVATDSSAILGIGDQGYGGLAISIGKLALYTVAGGVSPFHIMPVGLDVGTDRLDLVEDPFYLGVRQPRLRGESYLAFIDAFVAAIRVRYPRALIQWEDLSKDTAFTVLERYRKVTPSFNDDIQGTGAVALAGVISSCLLSGTRLRDQRVVIHGAGAGGAGVAWAIREGMVRDGLTREEAGARIFVLDSKGLLTTSRAMEDYKRTFAQDMAKLPDFKCAGQVPTLIETIHGAKATVLLGLSGQPNTFNEPIVRAMAANIDRPMIFPLSNPTSSCEALPEDIFAWSNGRALVATGSPFAPVKVGDAMVEIGQGNNAFIFPGLGFGAILCEAREITDDMVLAGAEALAAYTAERHVPHGRIYPPVEELREVSLRVATAVVREAQKNGVAGKPIAEAEIDGFVRARAWKAEYLPFTKG